MPPTPPSSSKTVDAEHTLWHHLSSNKPELKATPRSKSRTNTNNQSWRRPSKVMKWEDFDCASLLASCRGLFSEMLAQSIEPLTFPHLEKRTIRFADEDALQKHYVSQWTHPIIMTALSNAQRQSKHRKLQPPFVEMVAGGNAQAQVQHGPRYMPDWAGTRATEPDDPHQIVNILPGDTKVSNKWKSAEIVPKDVDEDDMVENWYRPLKQIFTYCTSLKTRYGYIITDEEVVAIRVRASPERVEEKKPKRKRVSSEEKSIIEYASILDSTQDPNGEKRLTMNLAIWWLHLLAANNRTILETYDPLGKEELDGLGKAPTPTYETLTSSEAATRDPASPTATVDTYANATDSEAIISSQLSAFEHSYGSMADPTGSCTPMGSFESTRSKRKRDSVDP